MPLNSTGWFTIETKLKSMICYHLLLFCSKKVKIFEQLPRLKPYHYSLKFVAENETFQVYFNSTQK